MLKQFIRQLGRTEIKLPAKRFLSTSSKLQKASKPEVAPEKPKTIVIEKDKNITLIGINRPQHRNAINPETASQLCEAFSNFEADETSPVAVLYGIGGSFCSGFDVLAMGRDKKADVSVDILMRSEGSIGPTRRIIAKPVVCGISGYCIANGLELALMCDLRVMEESAVLGFFNRRFGVPMLDGGSARLPAMIGLSRALDLVLTGRAVGAQEAHEIGLVNRVVPTGSSLCQAIDLAKCLASFPQGALNHDRKSVYTAAFDAGSFHQAVQNEVMLTSSEIIEEMQNGIKWFNKTFEVDTTHSWLKREMSMADWDDDQVVEAAVEKEEQKKAEEVERIEAKKKKDEEKQNKRAKAKKAIEEPPKEVPKAQ